jgi:hypothetical protein
MLRLLAVLPVSGRRTCEELLSVGETGQRAGHVGSQERNELSSFDGIDNARLSTAFVFSLSLYLAEKCLENPGS